MKRIGLEQKEMADFLGITQGYFSSLLVGRNRVSNRLGYKIDNIDFYSLEAKK